MLPVANNGQKFTPWILKADLVDESTASNVFGYTAVMTGGSNGMSMGAEAWEPAFRTTVLSRDGIRGGDANRRDVYVADRTVVGTPSTETVDELLKLDPRSNIMKPPIAGA